MNKQWYLSRGIWIGAITGLVGSLELVRDAVINGDFSTAGLITLALGVLKVWERITRTV